MVTRTEQPVWRSPRKGPGTTIERQFGRQARNRPGLECADPPSRYLWANTAPASSICCLVTGVRVKAVGAPPAQVVIRNAARPTLLVATGISTRSLGVALVPLRRCRSDWIAD